MLLHFPIPQQVHNQMWPMALCRLDAKLFCSNNLNNSVTLLQRLCFDWYINKWLFNIGGTCILHMLVYVTLHLNSSPLPYSSAEHCFSASVFWNGEAVFISSSWLRECLASTDNASKGFTRIHLTLVGLFTIYHPIWI